MSGAHVIHKSLNLENTGCGRKACGEGEWVTGKESTTRSLTEHRVLKQESRSPKLEVTGGRRGCAAGYTGHEQELDKIYTSQNEVRQKNEVLGPN